MKIAVVNYSPTAYNLATSKMVHKFEEDGHAVQFNTVVDAWMRTGESRPDRAYLSAIFTWDLKEMVRGATDLLVSGVPVEMGAPAFGRAGLRAGFIAFVFRAPARSAGCPTEAGARSRAFAERGDYERR